MSSPDGTTTISIPSIPTHTQGFTGVLAIQTHNRKGNFRRRSGILTRILHEDAGSRRAEFAGMIIDEYSNLRPLIFQDANGAAAGRQGSVPAKQPIGRRAGVKQETIRVSGLKGSAATFA